MSGHSQAPWRVNVGALSFDDVVIATVESTAHDALEIVCKRSGHNDDPIPNARLMAAAPVLLEALKLVLDVDGYHLAANVIEAINAAINSADGED